METDRGGRGLRHRSPRHPTPRPGWRFPVSSALWAAPRRRTSAPGPRSTPTLYCAHVMRARPVDGERRLRRESGLGIGREEEQERGEALKEFEENKAAAQEENRAEAS